MKYEKFAQIINENGKFSECAIDCLYSLCRKSLSYQDVEDAGLCHFFELTINQFVQLQYSRYHEYYNESEDLEKYKTIEYTRKLIMEDLCPDDFLLPNGNIMSCDDKHCFFKKEFDKMNVTKYENFFDKNIN